MKEVNEARHRLQRLKYVEIRIELEETREREVLRILEIGTFHAINGTTCRQRKRSDIAENNMKVTSLLSVRGTERSFI